MAPSMDALADDLAAESADLRAMLAAAVDEAGLAARHPGRGLDDRRPGLATSRTSTTPPLRSAIDPDAFRAELEGGGRRGPGRDRRAVPRTCPGPRCWRGSTGRGRGSSRVPRARPGAAGALVRAADERGVVADRADHGDLGARPGRGRRARGRPRADRTGCGTSRTSGSRARAFSYALHGRRCPRSRSGSSWPRRTGAVWTWGPADAADRVSGPALDFALLSPSAGTATTWRCRSTGRSRGSGSRSAQAFAGAPGTGRRAGQFA